MDALPALGREECDDVVAGLDRAHFLTHLLDDSRTLVPEDARRVPAGIGTRRRVQVGVTDTARSEPNERLAGLRFLELELLDD